MIPLLRLELRKNALAAASLALAFLLCLAYYRRVAAAAGMDFAKALEGLIVAWMFPGLYLAAAMLAAVAGAGLATAPSRDAEALLPASPRRRATAAAMAGAVLTLAIVLLVVGTGYVSDALIGGLANPRILQLLAFLMADIFIASFALSYAFGHALAGGCAGIIFTLAALIQIGSGVLFHDFLRTQGLSYKPWLATAVGAFLPGSLLSLDLLLRRGERRAPARVATWLGIVVGLAAAPLALYAGFHVLTFQLSGKLRLEPAGMETSAEPAAGALASSLDGALYWLTPETVFEAAPPLPSQRAHAPIFDFFNPAAAVVHDAAWHQGALWVLREPRPSVGRSELWTGNPGKGLGKTEDLPAGRWYKLGLWKGRLSVAEGGPAPKTNRVCAVGRPVICGVAPMKDIQRFHRYKQVASGLDEGTKVRVQDGLFLEDHGTISFRDARGAVRRVEKP